LGVEAGPQSGTLSFAVENGQVHQSIMENLGDDHNERLSPVDMGKAQR
jgi:hypothetical protein